MRSSTQKNKKNYLRRGLSLVLLFEIIFGVVFFGLGFFGERIGAVKGREEFRGMTKEEAREAFIEGALEKMSLEEKIGQMIISQNPERVRELRLGGLILMGKDMTTLEETRELVLSLAEDEKTGVPRILATDQEGGVVQRLEGISDFYAETGFEEIPEMFTLGETGDEELARETGRKIAEQVKAVGLNMTFAPVLDIYSNPYNTVIGTRSFSNETETVGKMGVALGEGLEEGGVLGVYKHFPGHGDTAVDSHYNLPIIRKSLEELEEEELVPFRRTIEAGAKMIMVGHISLPEITGDETPASLSREMITGILRERLGFSGLIVTDGMNMGAITNNYSGGEAAALAIKAGADLILMPENEEEAISGVLEAVKVGEISEEEIIERVRKLIVFKTEEFWG